MTYAGWFKKVIRNTIFYWERADTPRSLFTCLGKSAIKDEFTWWRLIQMHQIVNFECQSCILPGSEIKISLCKVLCKCHYKEGFLWKMTQQPKKLQVFYEYKSTWWRFIKRDRTVQLKSVSFFFLSSEVRFDLRRMV